MLLAKPRPSSLEVVCDANGFIANFWRAVKHQPAAVAEWADYPVSHIDLGARHVWIVEQRARIGAALHDPDWPGDAKVAGWWLWGQCCWIGSGWCDWFRDRSKGPNGSDLWDQTPHASDAGRGFDGLLTSSGRAAWVWLHKLADRLERVRIVHGDWSRCLNNHYGGDDTAVFLDPPYEGYGEVYGTTSVAQQVGEWARDNAHLRIALCGHIGDYDLPGWDIQQWSRGKFTYSGSKTTDSECIWYSPACLPNEANQTDLFVSFFAERELADAQEGA